MGTGCYFSFDSDVLFSYKTTLVLNVILSAWWSRGGSGLDLGGLFCLGVLFLPRGFVRAQALCGVRGTWPRGKGGFCAHLGH